MALITSAGGLLKNKASTLHRRSAGQSAPEASNSASNVVGVATDFERHRSISGLSSRAASVDRVASSESANIVAVITANFPLLDVALSARSDGASTANRLSSTLLGRWFASG